MLLDAKLFEADSNTSHCFSIKCFLDLLMESSASLGHVDDHDSVFQPVLSYSEWSRRIS